MDPVPWEYGVIIGVVAAIALAVMLVRPLLVPRGAPYEKRPSLLDPAGQDFFHVLHNAIAGQWRIFAMVHLADLIRVRPTARRHDQWQEQIDGEHVDFVICDPETLEPRLAIKLDEPDHPLNKAFCGKGFLIKDEIYKIKDPYSRDNLRILLSLDMSNKRNKPGRPDNDNAISWIRELGQGRVFYCSLGHNNQIFWNPAVLRHYLDGIQYALGDLKADATPSAKLSTKPQPALCPEE